MRRAGITSVQLWFIAGNANLLIGRRKPPENPDTMIEQHPLSYILSDGGYGAFLYRRAPIPDWTKKPPEKPISFG
jgi:hypothetical protein